MYKLRPSDSCFLTFSYILTHVLQIMQPETRSYDLTQVTHDEMVAAPNHAYIQMYTENLKLKGSLETYQYVLFFFFFGGGGGGRIFSLFSNRKLFDTFASGIKTSHDPPKEDLEELEPLIANNYPAVKFWYKDQRFQEDERRKKHDEEHNVRRPKGRSSEENVRFWFLENADGTTVARPIVSRLRAEAKAIWERMSKKYGSMNLPWTSVSTDRQLEFWIKLEREYPFLRLCAHHYKANAIATSDYTHWYKRRFPDTPSTSNHGTGLTSSSGSPRKRQRPSKPIRSRKLARCGTAPHRAIQLSSDDEDEEETDNDDDEDDEDEEDEEEEEKVTVKEEVVEVESSSDTKGANKDDSASVSDALEDIRQVSHLYVITYYHNTLHRCKRNV